MKYGKGQQDIPCVNVVDAALIFEGGGMRASYTSAVAARMIEDDINFAHVYGISAGSSNAVNYVSRDVLRTRESFTGYVSSREHIGWHRMLKGMYFFDGPWIYEGAATRYVGSDAAMEFDWDMFMANPAEVHIEAYDVESQERVLWTKADMPDAVTMMRQVRASSSLPGFMEPTVIDGRTYLDGGLSEDWGIALMPAVEDGFDRFFIVRTQPRGYRKKPVSPAMNILMKRMFCGMPQVLEQIQRRVDGYNRLCDKIEELERAGAAYVFYPEKMDVTNKTTDVQRLYASLADGEEQARRECEAWKGWLGL